MRLARDDIEAALRKKGFRESEVADHRKFHFWTLEQKKTAIWTKTSHGTKYKVLSDDLVAKMAKQVKLKTRDFAAFVACDVEQEQYEQILSKQGLL